MRVGRVLAQSVLRTTWIRTLLVTGVLSLSLGFALFAATGARRTSSALDRFVEWSVPPDVSTGGGAGEVPVAARLDDLAALEPVLESQRIKSIGILGAEVDGETVPPSRFFAGAFDGPIEAASFDRPLVLRGEIPDEPAADEGAIDFVTAERLDLDLGDEIRLIVPIDPEGEETRAIPVHVVAIVSSPTSLPTLAGYHFNGVILGPAFIEANPETVDPFAETMSIRLRNGPGGVEEMRAAMEEAGLGDIDLAGTFVATEAGADRLFEVEATAMWVAAFLALLVGLPIAYQLQRRDAAANRPSIDILLAIGASRRQVLAGALVRGLLLGTSAAGIAAVGAVLASPASPVGMARNAEVDDGVWVDTTLLAVGLPLFVLTVAGLGAAATWRAMTARSATASSAWAPRWFGGRVRTAMGVGMATGGRDVRGAAGLGAIALVGTLVVGMVVAVGSLAAVPEDAEVSGGVWDAFIEAQPQAADEVDRLLDEMPQVRAHGDGGWFELQVGDVHLYTISLPQVEGMEPAMVRGRAPRTDNEVALGAAAMRRLGVGIGDVIEARLAGRDAAPIDLEVTGEMIVAAPLFQAHAPDDAALVTINIHDVVETDGHRDELVRFTAHLDPEEALDTLMAQLPPESLTFGFARGERGDVLVLGRLQGLVRALLAMAAALALASIVHQLLVTHRRHAHGLAVTRAMGFTSRDVTLIGTAHGATLIGITVLVAVPLGIALGSVAWRYLADGLLVLPRVTTEVTMLLVGVVAVWLAAMALAAALAHGSARRTVACELRHE